MFLVDNLIYSYASDLERGVHILNFYDDKEDRELQYLSNVLHQFKPYSDVADFLDRAFGF